MATPAPASPQAPLPPPPMQQSGGTQNVTYVVYQMPAAGASPDYKIDWKNCFRWYVARAFLQFLLWASWVIYIAGCAKNNQNCNNGYLNGGTNGAGAAPFPDIIALNTLNLGATSAGDCARTFGLLWWSVWLQFTVILMTTATTFKVLRRTPGVKGVFTLSLYFIIMSSVLMFFQANIYNNALYLNQNKISYPNNEWTVSCSLTLVGAITCLILNFIYLIYNSYNDVPALPGVPAGTHLPKPPATGSLPTVEAQVEAEGAKATAA